MPVAVFLSAIVAQGDGAAATDEIVDPTAAQPAAGFDQGRGSGLAFAAIDDVPVVGRGQCATQGVSDGTLGI